jgi:hypothetical protein
MLERFGILVGRFLLAAARWRKLILDAGIKVE